MKLYLQSSLLLVLAASMAQGAAPDAHTRGLIGQLDARSWLERDLATIELAELDPGVTLDDLEAFIGDPRLSPEQRARLITACTRRFLDHPKGALGVAFGTIRIGAIEVQPIDKSDAFPASKVLNPGDQIAMVGGTVIEGSFELRAQIISRDPGEVIPVTIIRRDAQTGQDRLLELDLELGSFDSLTGGARLDPALVERALELRWARGGISMPAHRTIGADLDLGAWSDAAFPQGTTADPRTPDRRTSTVLIADAHQPVQTGYGYTPAQSKPWAGPGELVDNAKEIDGRLRAGVIQTLVARRLLLEQERRQLMEEIESGQWGAQAAGLRARVDAVTDELDAISAEIEADRGLDTSPDAVPQDP